LQSGRSFRYTAKRLMGQHGGGRSGSISKNSSVPRIPRVFGIRNRQPVRGLRTPTPVQSKKKKTFRGPVYALGKQDLGKNRNTDNRSQLGGCRYAYWCGKQDSLRFLVMGHIVAHGVLTRFFEGHESRRRLNFRAEGRCGGRVFVRKATWL